MLNNSPSPVRALTRKQEACLAPAPNRIVSAGAGSGKTLVLVEKIGRLLMGSGDPGPAVGTEHFLALTFTRKAAGEMRSRVYRALLERPNGSSDVERTRLERLRERFQTAKITTIHGFASSLIRSNPVTLGIDPDFQLLEESAGAETVRDSTNRVLRDVWNKKRPLLIELVALWEPSRLRKVIEELLHRPIEFRELCDCYDTEAILALVDRVRQARWAAIMTVAREDGGWLTHLDAIHAHCLEVIGKKGNARNQRDQREKAQRLIDEFVNPLREVLKAASPEGFDIAAVKALRRDVKEIGSFRWNAPTALKILDGITESLGPWLGSMEREREALEWTGLLLELAGEAHARLDRDKSAQGRLFHDDLLILARDLCVQQPHDTRGPIRHLLVDEFQDTDPIQWDMILTLARTEGNKPRNLFLVGDVKQAIYGFRGADHTVFRSAREFLSEISSDTNLEVVLDDNFRSLTGPLHFTNELFARMFRAEDVKSDPYSVPAQPLVSQRESDDPSSVVFLICDYESEDPWIAEARAAVALLRRIYSGEEPRYSRISAMMRAAKPAVGILFRTYAPMTHYIGELSRAGLPFSVYHGRTFLQTTEVQTLMSLLSWMADPGDDSALAAVLRSPLCAWTDEDLTSVADPARTPRIPLHQILNSEVENGRDLLPSGASRVRTWRHLQRIRRLAGHLSLSETLRLALDGITGTIVLRGAVRGLQASANIEKFLQLVRDLEESRHSSPQVVVQALRDLEEEGPGVAEAEPPTSERVAIQLMTIHAAKGLEFPMVISACSGKASGGARQRVLQRVILSDAGKPGGLRRMTLCGIDFPDPSADHEPTPTMLNTFLKEHHAQQTESEEKRLLYVALTRACDHLVVPLCVAQEKIRAAGRSLARFMLDAAPEIEQAILSGDDRLEFGQGACEFRYSHEFPTETARTETIVPRFPDCGWSHPPLAPPIKGGETQTRSCGETGEEEVGPVCFQNLENFKEKGHSVDEQISQIDSLAFDPAAKENLTRELPYKRRVRVTVTDLMTFRKCPRRFYFERFFRAPEASVSFGEESVDDAGPQQEGAGRMVGSIVHRMVQRHETCLVAWEPGTPWPDELIEDLGRAVRDHCGPVETLPGIGETGEVDNAPLTLLSPAGGESLVFPSLDGRGKGRVNAAAVADADHHGSARSDPLSLRNVALVHLENVARSGILAPTAGGQAVVLREIPFEWEHHGFLIAGAIDRLEQDPDSGWRLWDFKTTSLTGRTKEDVVREECYDLQLSIYASAAVHILGQPVSQAAVVFTGDPENPLFPIETDTHARTSGVDDVLSELSGSLDVGFNGFASTGRTCRMCPYEALDLCRR
ncbi:MAG: UvrD-helicase domain-containing protein [Thermodesulfobacteriota bacterium]